MSWHELTSPAALLAIAGMTAATWLMRVSGFWLMGHVPLTPRVRRMLEAMPGAIVVAIVFPILVKSGLTAMMAMIGAATVMLIRRNEFLAVLVGVLIAAGMRWFGFP